MDRTAHVALNTVAHDGNFLTEGMLMRYSSFMPRLYNFCKSIGMSKGLIMPSRAFCSDESQGFPIILITKHFGAFPFNHGRLGGVLSTDRHEAYAVHGRDLMIIQAAHVGYDPTTDSFGVYRRLQREDQCDTSACGRIGAIVKKYQIDYRFAQNNIFVKPSGDRCIVTIDNQLLDPNRRSGLFLDLDFMLEREESSWYKLVKAYSTSKSFVASAAFTKRLRDRGCGGAERKPLGAALTPELFRFKRSLPESLDNQLERNILGSMSYVVASDSPLLAAAQANAQAEFDRAWRSISTEPSYRGKTLMYIAGVNIDVSPNPGQMFPTTLFLPWAAYVQPRGSDPYILEQAELVERLMAQSRQNPDQIDFNKAIDQMRADHIEKLEGSTLQPR